jgi:hypothetical protein
MSGRTSTTIANLLVVAGLVLAMSVGCGQPVDNQAACHDALVAEATAESAQMKALSAVGTGPAGQKANGDQFNAISKDEATRLRAAAGRADGDAQAAITGLATALDATDANVEGDGGAEDRASAALAKLRQVCETAG